MTKKVGKERDNGKQKERDSLGPRAQGMGGRGEKERGEGEGSEWERDRTEYREEVVFALLNWFC